MNDIFVIDIHGKGHFYKALRCDLTTGAQVTFDVFYHDGFTRFVDPRAVYVDGEPVFSSTERRIAALTKENGYLQECIKHDDAELRELRSDEGKPLNFEELKFLGEIRGMFPGDSLDHIKTTIQYLTERANEGGRAITKLNRIIDAVRQRREAARSAQSAALNEKHLIDELMQ